MGRLDAAEDIKAAVYQAIGVGSVCWEDLSGAGVFNDQLAREVGEELLERIEAHVAERIAALRQQERAGWKAAK